MRYESTRGLKRRFSAEPAEVSSSDVPPLPHFVPTGFPPPFYTALQLPHTEASGVIPPAAKRIRRCPIEFQWFAGTKQPPADEKETFRPPPLTPRRTLATPFGSQKAPSSLTSLPLFSTSPSPGLFFSTVAITSPHPIFPAPLSAKTDVKRIKSAECGQARTHISVCQPRTRTTPLRRVFRPRYFPRPCPAIPVQSDER